MHGTVRGLWVPGGRASLDAAVGVFTASTQSDRTTQIFLTASMMSRWPLQPLGSTTVSPGPQRLAAVAVGQEEETWAHRHAAWRHGATA